MKTLDRQRGQYIDILMRFAEETHDESYLDRIEAMLWPPRVATGTGWPPYSRKRGGPDA